MALKSASSVRAPASRTGSKGRNLDALAPTRRTVARTIKPTRQNPPVASRRCTVVQSCRVGLANRIEQGKRIYARALDEHFASHPSTFVAANDAPLIGGRAAARGRSTIESGDEHVGVNRRYQFALQPREPARPAGTLSRSRVPDRLRRVREDPARRTQPPTSQLRSARGEMV
jgi:hypothetical protein